MAPKSVLAEFQRHILKQSLEVDRSNSLRSTASKEPKGKKAAKEKKVIQVDLEDSPTLKPKSEFNILAKDFPYLEFMDKVLMTSAYLQ